MHLKPTSIAALKSPSSKPSSKSYSLSRPTRASVLSSHIESVVSVVRPPSLPSLPLYAAPRGLSNPFRATLQDLFDKADHVSQEFAQLYPLCTQSSQATQCCPSHQPNYLVVLCVDSRMLGRVVSFVVLLLALSFVYPQTQRYPPFNRAAREHPKGVLSHDPSVH